MFIIFKKFVCQSNNQKLKYESYRHWILQRIHAYRIQQKRCRSWYLWLYDKTKQQHILIQYGQLKTLVPLFFKQHQFVLKCYIFCFMTSSSLSFELYCVDTKLRWPLSTPPPCPAGLKLEPQEVKRTDTAPICII